ncbi:hypothetical protein [Streptomyces sp. NPDC014006]|uniref:hypothetical protein n=1 Tax=Streptomyces sp. NPDC014006 TaxID=3364870 RepID=UPI0036FA052A
MATARLLNAPALYDALAAHPEADLAVLLSDDVFRSHVAGGHTTLRTGDFTRVAVHVKEYEAPAWLRVLALDAATASHEHGSAAPASGEPTAGRPAPAAAGGAPGISNDYRADSINVTNMSGPVDARGAVFGFGSTGA